MAAQSFSGTTRDAAGVRMSSVVVNVFDSTTKALLGSSISDSTGNFIVSWDGTSTSVFARAYLLGQPDTAGTTVNTAPDGAAPTPPSPTGVHPTYFILGF